VSAGLEKKKKDNRCAKLWKRYPVQMSYERVGTNLRWQS
jgi:hypothetical protein